MQGKLHALRNSCNPRPGRWITIARTKPDVSQKPDDTRLREVFNTLESYIERRYGIPVVISDVPDPFTGDLDGSEIRVDYANDVEASVFIIAQPLRPHGPMEP
jgi:hypothetical protein